MCWSWINRPRIPLSRPDICRVHCVQPPPEGIGGASDCEQGPGEPLHQSERFVGHAICAYAARQNSDALHSSDQLTFDAHLFLQLIEIMVPEHQALLILELLPLLASDLAAKNLVVHFRCPEEQRPDEIFRDVLGHLWRCRRLCRVEFFEGPELLFLRPSLRNHFAHCGRHVCTTNQVTTCCAHREIMGEPSASRPRPQQDSRDHCTAVTEQCFGGSGRP